MKSLKPIKKSFQVLAGGGARWCYWLVCWMLAGVGMVSQAQISLNVTNYGAKGDCAQVWVSTVSNSVVVSFTNSLSAADIGKTVELFDVGQRVSGPDAHNSAIAGWIAFNNLTGSNCMRVLGVITNIVGTNVYVDRQTVYSTPGPATSGAMEIVAGYGGIPAVITNVSAAPSVFYTGSPISTNYIGKSIDIYINASFNANNGPYLGTSGGCYIYANPFVAHCQSVIATITNVSGSTAYLSGDLPSVTTNLAYCIYGTNNAAAFQSAVNAASGSNVTITVPAGTFLMLPPSQYTNHVLNVSGVSQAFIINKGGFELVGAGRGQTILMACGAWKQKSGWYVYDYDQTTPRSLWQCQRGLIFSCVGPITNNYPIAFRGMSFDGGMPLALTGNQGIYPGNPFDGLGWDGTSDAGQDSGSGALNILKTFDGCEFRHFMGEMIKGITGTDGNGADTVVTNCVFWDGNATAFNYNTSHTITGCSFSNMFQIEEFYLKYSNQRPSYFINNFATNIYHNFVSLNGGTLTNQPYVISNNVLYGYFGGNAIASCPAAHVVVASNTIVGQSGANIAAVVVGQNGAQPGSSDAFNTDWKIFGNRFIDCAVALGLYEGSVVMDNSHADGVWFHNNTITTTANMDVRLLLSFAWSTNIFIYSNDCSGVIGKVLANSGVNGAKFSYVATNNSYWFPLIVNGESGQAQTNAITYGSGSRFLLKYPYNPNVPNYLVRSDSSQIPTGLNVAVMITNAAAGGANVPIYLDETLTRSVIIPNAKTATFYWTGAAWTTNSPPASPPASLLPPSNLRVQ